MEKLIAFFRNSGTMPDCRDELTIAAIVGPDSDLIQLVTHHYTYVTQF